MRGLRAADVRPWLRSWWVRAPYCIATLPLIPVVAFIDCCPEMWRDMRENFVTNIRGLLPLEGG